MHDFTTSGLVGHRDVGNTSCPGKNLYARMASYTETLDRETETYTAIKNPIYRAETLDSPRTPNTPKPSPPRSVTHLGPTIRIKLSLPAETKSLELEVLEGTPLLQFDATRGSTSATKIQIQNRLGKLVLTLDGKKYRGRVIGLAGDLVRVNTWSRKPSWDTS